MTSSANLRRPRAAARTGMIGAALALVAWLVFMLAVPTAQAAAPPAGLAARDWQAIEAQLPAAPQSWPAAGGAIEQDKLVASDAQASDYFGYSVAVSGDTVVVGTPFEDSAGSSAGTAYVFVRNGTSWVQQDKLMANDAEMLDQFGLSVAVSGDTVVVGANGEDSEGNAAGAAYVFVRNGTSWNEQDKLTASDAQADDRFGHSVAVAGDTVVVGAFLEDEGGSDAGAAYVFVRNGTTWNEQDKLVASDAETGDWFGRSVAVSGDIVAVGALGEAEGGTDAGAAYVFVRNGTSWDEQDKLVASDAQAYDYFGVSVAVSGDTVVVGAYGEDDGGTDAGAAYVFKRNGTSWSQQDKLMAGDAQAGDRFGYSVAVSGDTVVVGAYREDSGGTNAGAAYVFVYDGTTWDEQQKLMASDAAASDNFGHSVAVSGDTVVVGTPFEDSAGSDVGAAYVYVPGYAVEVDVGGLSGTGLVLQNNGGDDLAIAADGLHAFSTLLADGSAYDVTVATQPTDPPQTCTVTNGSGTIAEASVTVDVTCATNTYTVTASASGSGTVTPGSQSVSHGGSATITVTPHPGHHVTSVTGDTCTPADNGDGTWTATNITADCAITATFAIDAYTVTASANGNGTITPTDAQVEYGDDAVFTVTPATGWHLDVVSGDTCTLVDQGAGTWIAGPITAACHVQAWFSIDLHTIGGSVTGLSGAGLMLQLNGGHDLAIAADGPFTFATQVPYGQSYVATVASKPDGQACTIANGTGTVGDADITDLAVTCAAVGAGPVLAIDDGREYARYGRTVDYMVTLANTGDAPIDDADVVFAPSAGFDAAFATLTCFAGSGICTADPADPLHYVATVPASGEVTWLVSIPVHGTTAEPSVELVVTATGATPAVDTNTLVILRDGFDVPYGDGAQGVEVIDGERAKTILEGDDVARIVVPDIAHATNDVDATPAVASRTLLRLHDETREVAIQQRGLHGTSLVRLIERSHGDNERTSEWREAAPGIELTLGSLALDDERRTVLLDGAGGALVIE